MLSVISRILFCFGAMPSGAQGLLLVLHLGIIPSGARGTIWDAGKHPTGCTIDLALHN